MMSNTDRLLINGHKLLTAVRRDVAGAPGTAAGTTEVSVSLQRKHLMMDDTWSDMPGRGLSALRRAARRNRARGVRTDNANLRTSAHGALMGLVQIIDGRSCLNGLTWRRRLSRGQGAPRCSHISPRPNSRALILLDGDGQPRLTLPALMQEVQTLTRFLLPPGRLTARTVWTLGSHRRLVRRWEWDTDLPKPGPFPQISHTAAIVQTPQVGCWGPTTRAERPGWTRPSQDSRGRRRAPKRHAP